MSGRGGVARRRVVGAGAFRAGALRRRRRRLVVLVGRGEVVCPVAAAVAVQRLHLLERGSDLSVVRLEAQGVPFGDASLDQMNALWDQAKALEKASK
jgi:stage V sporulation protein SpoVS